MRYVGVLLLTLTSILLRLVTLSHVKNLFCLPDKRGFLQLYPFLPERVIYLRYDIALRAMIYAFGIWRNGYYIMIAAGKYIIRQRRISYCRSDISLKSAAKPDIICSINKNLNSMVFKDIVGCFQNEVKRSKTDENKGFSANNSFHPIVRCYAVLPLSRKIVRAKSRARIIKILVFRFGERTVAM